jgi:serine protease
VPNGPDAGAATAPAPTPPGPDMAQQRVGTPCISDAQCDPGLICAKTFGIGPGHVDIPGGYCTHDCSSNACPANSICVTFTFGKYCASSCPPDPCRTTTGYVCCDESDGKACTPTALCPKGQES